MQERRYDLDWLRVIAILLLHFFHSAMPFVAEWGWHLKNKELSPLLMECNYFLSRWRMPLLFFTSGVGTMFLIKRVSAGQYALQRTKRLLLPLAFGMLVIVPPQVYMERIYNGAAYKNILEFYPTLFATGAYPKGNLSWHHLWFIAYLFVYSLLCIPLLLFLKSDNGAKITARLESLCIKAGMYWLVVPTFLASLLYFWYPEETHALINDWATFFRYFSFFIAGCFIGTNTVIWNQIRSKRRVSLRAAFAFTIAINYLRWNDIEPEWAFTVTNLAFLLLLVVSTWSWLLALMGYGKQYLNRDSRFLAYANEGIYPFYILHQTIIVILAYYVIQTNDNIFSKYLFLSFVSLFVTLGLYEFLVRPYNPVRILFGMKKRSAENLP